MLFGEPKINIWPCLCGVSSGWMQCSDRSTRQQYSHSQCVKLYSTCVHTTWAQRVNTGEFSLSCIWQYPVRGLIFKNPKQLFSSWKLYSWNTQIYSTSCFLRSVPNYSKWGKFQKLKNLTGWPKMKLTGLFPEYLGNQISDFQIAFFFWKLISIRIFWMQNHFCAVKGGWDICETKLVSWLWDGEKYPNCLI